MESWRRKLILTVVIVLRKVRLIDKQIVIPIELPEFTVDHVEMLVAEVGGDLVDVLLVFQDRDHRQQVAPSQLRHGDPSAPAPVNAVEYPGDHLDRFVGMIE